MVIEEGIFWDEHWVLYGNLSDNKFHILKKKKTCSLRKHVCTYIVCYVNEACILCWVEMLALQ